MPFTSTRPRIRCIVLPAVTHIVHERDGDFVRTLCNEIHRKAEVCYGTLKQFDNRCHACEKAFKGMFKSSSSD